MFWKHKSFEINFRCDLKRFVTFISRLVVLSFIFLRIRVLVDMERFSFLWKFHINHSCSLFNKKKSSNKCQVNMCWRAFFCAKITTTTSNKGLLGNWNTFHKYIFLCGLKYLMNFFYTFSRLMVICYDAIELIWPNIFIELTRSSTVSEQKKNGSITVPIFDSILFLSVLSFPSTHKQKKKNSAAANNLSTRDKEIEKENETNWRRNEEQTTTWKSIFNM